MVNSKQVSLVAIVLLAAACTDAAEPSEASGVAATEAIAYLHERRVALGMRSPHDELRVVRTHIDELSMTHVRLQQLERGLRVDGGDVSVHFDRSGHLASLDQRYVPNLVALDLAPAIDAARASAIASADRGTVTGAPELVVFARDLAAAPRVVWEVPVKASNISDWFVRVDARTGAVVHVESRVLTLTGSGIGLDGETHPVKFSINPSTNDNVLVDATRGFNVQFYDQNNLPLTNEASLITSADPTSWDTTSTLGPGSAVSAQLTLGAINDYYTKTFGRRGWLGDGSDERIVIHEADEDGTPGYDNAFYSAADNLIAIGDGKQLFKPLAQFVDVLAHEFTHGVTGATARLTADAQPGALNESISDCFGAIVEHSVKPDDVANWQIGEGSMTDGTPFLRSLSDPTTSDPPQPVHMSGFIQTTAGDLGIHTNDGIPNNAAFLAAMGGTNSVSKIQVKNGIGWEKFARVWFRADTIYLTSHADFASFARATLQAATDLGLTKVEIDTIDCAWKAVGVTQGACVDDTATASTPAGTDAGTTTKGAVDTGDDDDTTTKKPATNTAEPVVVRPMFGCNAGGASGSSDPLLLAVVAAVLVGLRRKFERDREDHADL